MTARNYARMNGTTVANVEVHDDSQPLDAALVLIDGITPTPGIGWTHANNVWTPPAPDPTVANGQTLAQRATAALATNATFLTAAASATYPLTTAEQQTLVNQVAALTKECTAIIRLLLGMLDSTAGT